VVSVVSVERYRRLRFENDPKCDVPANVFKTKEYLAAYVSETHRVTRLRPAKAARATRVTRDRTRIVPILVKSAILLGRRNLRRGIEPDRTLLARESRIASNVACRAAPHHRCTRPSAARALRKNKAIYNFLQRYFAVHFSDVYKRRALFLRDIIRSERTAGLVGCANEFTSQLHGARD